MLKTIGEEILKVKVEAEIPIKINYEEAFRLLCKTLDMECIFSDYDYEVKNIDGENMVYLNDEIYDERGDLYLSLLKVAKNIFPGI